MTPGGRSELFQNEGANVTEKTLTVVLPVYNGEARLKRCVAEILELASELTPRFEVLIIDDGSTDMTYEVAEELAARFPQVAVRRHRYRRGLGASLEAASRCIQSDVVIMHDGVTPIKPDDVRRLWRERVATSGDGHGQEADGSKQLPGRDELTALHASLARVHARVVGFQLVMPLRDVNPISSASPASRPPAMPRTDAAHTGQREGIGQIPPLPRPKFLTALADFALGE